MMRLGLVPAAAVASYAQRPVRTSDCHVIEEPIPEAAFKKMPLRLDGVDVFQLNNLKDMGFRSANVKNQTRDSIVKSATGQQYRKLIGETDYVLVDIVRHGDPTQEQGSVRGYLRAGPRETLHFDPKQVRAAIINCGGLCPGLNNVIHHLGQCV